MTDLERFTACMDYGTPDRVPNHELGVWPQTIERWRAESGSDLSEFHWAWFHGEDAIGLDRREYVPLHYGMIPAYESGVLEETEDYEIVRHWNGIVTKALKAGTVGGGRMCMDQYIGFPVTNEADWVEVRKRLVPAAPDRYPADLDARIEAWRTRDVPLVMGENCAANGFYWRARELLGTEELSFAWYDQPKLMHSIMEHYADLIIETSRPVLEQTPVEYFCLNEDFAGKGGPLIGPEQFREFISPHLTRMVEFFRSHGTRWFAVDSDGDPTPLIAPMMDAGVDTVWPIERAAGVDPLTWRKRFGKELRLWGGVDKRVLWLGHEAIREHLAELIPLIEEGGFIPTVDHTVPPEVPWQGFLDYLELKGYLLRGEFERLR